MNIPVFVKVDDPVYAKSTGLKSLQHRVEKIFNGKTLRNADKIFVVNESIKKIIIKEYKIDKEKITIISNGIDKKIFRKKITNKQNNIIIFSEVMYHHIEIDVLL